MVCYCLRGNWNKKSGITQKHCAAMINEKVCLELKSCSVPSHTQDIPLSCHESVTAHIHGSSAIARYAHRDTAAT